jgi:hypothetical protein
LLTVNEVDEKELFRDALITVKREQGRKRRQKKRREGYYKLPLANRVPAL